MPPDDSAEPAPPHRRRPRYRGTHPRRFDEKYKEHQPERYADTVERVRASGKTPAGQHLPILLNEILEVLRLQPGQRAVDCTLGYGGHAMALLRAVQPGGALLALDQDPVEIARAEGRLRRAGFGDECLRVRRSNFAGLRRALEEAGWGDGADAVLADLGVSSMQIDNPARGFSFKHRGPLDMRMNPQRGQSAREWLRKTGATALAEILAENADEPYAARLAERLAGQDCETTQALVALVQAALPARTAAEDQDACARRVFQALRIAVNEEFTALEALLRQLPDCLRPGGRVAILSFHSGEDRRVKQAFRDGLRGGVYREVCPDVVRPGPEERRANPRSTSAKLRWAVRA